ncbi:MAG: GntR family transcriptional regulator [Proteobacteria bacterium]|nr:GntR family transcriptional regulator [Pseudomonadota bacterium]
MQFHIPDSLSDHITGYIENKIITLELKPGQRILEANLAEEMGVSRGPIRDSLRTLEKSWLVERLPRKCAHVSKLTENHVNSIFEVLIELYAIFVRR